MPVFPIGSAPQLEKRGNPSLVLPEVLRELYLGRRTGLLHVARGEDRVSFRFVNGEVVSGSSTSNTGRLGETMVRHGLLALQDLVRALVVVHEQRRRLGPVLREMGIIDESRMEQALALHIRDMLLTAVVWDEAAHQFEDQELPEGPTEDLTLRCSTGELILEVVRSISSRETVRQGLGDVDRVLVAVSNPPFRLERITLNPADGYVLSRVDGAATARDIMSITPLPMEDVERSLLGLLCTGVVEFRPGAAPPRRPVENKTSAKAPALQTVSPERLAELRKAVAQGLDGLSSKDHFEVLGVRRTASATEVKDAFIQLVKLFHPDKQGELDSGLKSKRNTVFGRIHEAYRILGSPEKRKRYEGSLRDDPHPVSKAAEPPSSPKAEATPATATEPGKTIERAYEGLSKKSHFQVLGLPRTASLADVKAAHARLLKTFHPDSHPDLPPDLKSKLQAVFTRIDEAHAVLATPERRVQYEQSLRESTGSSPKPDPSPSPAPAVSESDPARAAAAGDTPSVEEALGTAEGHIAEGRYAEAVPLLESIVPLARGTLERRVRLLLARGYSMKSEWARKAEGELQRLIRLDPQDAEAHCALGKFYRDRSLPGRARAMFQRALELQPGHRTARAELAVLRPSEPDSPTLFGKLLRKAR